MRHKYFFPNSACYRNANIWSTDSILTRTAMSLASGLQIACKFSPSLWIESAFLLYFPNLTLCCKVKQKDKPESHSKIRDTTQENAKFKFNRQNGMSCGAIPEKMTTARGEWARQQGASDLRLWGTRSAAWMDSSVILGGWPAAIHMPYTSSRIRAQIRNFRVRNSWSVLNSRERNLGFWKWNRIGRSL